MIKEDFLHYLWQFQKFNTSSLITQDGKSLKVLKIGYRNTHAGPDFSESRLIIDDIEWAGQIEIHIKSSDWDHHKHQFDKAYDSVILHVVWEYDKPIFRSDGTELQVLVLKDIALENSLEKYKQLVGSNEDIACKHSIQSVPDIVILNMLDQALARRFESKTQWLNELFEGDFEELSYRLLLNNIGFKLNSESFLQIARILPWKILRKHQGNLIQTEALLFGMAGLLKNPVDEYGQQLKSEFDFLKHKYDLKESQIHWKFLRTRPANFPTVRLAQLASILYQTPSLFSLFIENTEISEINKTLSVLPSEYWQSHYDFGKISSKPIGSMGASSVENIMINTVVRLLVFYSQKTDNHAYFEKATDILENLKPEKNYITRIWEAMGFKIKNAFDSQAFIEQYNNFCTDKKCAQCSVGIEILKV